MLSAALRPTADLYRLKAVIEEWVQRRQNEDEFEPAPFGGGDEFFPAPFDGGDDGDDEELVFVDQTVEQNSTAGVPSVEAFVARLGVDAATMPTGLRGQLEEVLARMTHPAEVEMLLNMLGSNEMPMDMFGANMGDLDARYATRAGAASSTKTAEERKKQARKRKQRRGRRKRK